jgi:hypothetical protein
MYHLIEVNSLSPMSSRSRSERLAVDFFRVSSIIRSLSRADGSEQTSTISIKVADGSTVSSVFS